MIILFRNKKQYRNQFLLTIYVNFISSAPFGLSDPSNKYL